MENNDDHGDHSELLSPLEVHIIDLCAELSACIAGLVGDDESDFPLGEFDQRLLLEHTQLVERYVLAQAAARAYPHQFRAIGKSVPSSHDSGIGRDDHGYSHAGEHEHEGHEHEGHEHEGHEHEGHEHGHSVQQHLVLDTNAAREAHSQGRAIIGEHPWANDHAHGENHDHPDEWDWEPIDSSTSE